ncbi:hypothetical protein P3T16_002173 [Paraburkholderia sp. GAS42]
MTIEKVLYRAHAHVTGGRDGHATDPENNLDLKLTAPKKLGGGGGHGRNPEQLFVAGYSACFLHHGPPRFRAWALEALGVSIFNAPHRTREVAHAVARNDAFDKCKAGDRAP